MLCVSRNKNIVIYSMGKTGSTSLQEALTGLDDWKTTGEFFMNDPSIPDITSQPDGPGIQYRQLALYVEQGLKPVFIIRDPLKRYISGLKEIIFDYISVFDSFEHLHYELFECDKLESFLGRIIYLSEHTISQEEQEKYKWGQGFSVNTNYHTRNWLIDIVQDYPNAQIVTVDDLDAYTISLGATPKRTNVSDETVIKQVKKAYNNLRNNQAFANYLEPEILAYQQLVR